MPNDAATLSLFVISRVITCWRKAIAMVFWWGHVVRGDVMTVRRPHPITKLTKLKAQKHSKHRTNPNPETSSDRTVVFQESHQRRVDAPEAISPLALHGARPSVLGAVPASSGVLGNRCPPGAPCPPNDLLIPAVSRGARAFGRAWPAPPSRARR